MFSGIIAGIIMIVVGASGGIYSAITISSEMAAKSLDDVYTAIISSDASGLAQYTYTAPFSQHETIMITIAVLSALAVIGGIHVILCTIGSKQARELSSN
ncbi:MAG: hypothetical protein ACI3XD_04710 [Oscillospiraceae bacterium]